jgi:hypothetical protein
MRTAKEVIAMSEFVVRRKSAVGQDAPEAEANKIPRRDPALVEAVRRLNPEKYGRYEIDPDPDVPIPDGDADEQDWELYFAYLEKASSVREGLGSSVKQLRWQAPDDGPAGIAFIGDIHAGANIDYLRFRAVLNAVAETPGMYAICMGDLWENAKVMSKSGNALYTSLFAGPKDQYQYIKLRFNLLRGKWLAILGGNHDSRDYTTAGLDRLPELCAFLDAPYMTEAGGTIFAEVGDQRYVIAVKHTWRGKSQLNKTNQHRRFFDEWPEWANCDILATAHLHDPICHQEIRKGRIVTYLQCGTMKTHDDWAEMNGYQPSFGVPVIILDGTEHKVTALSDFDEGVAFLNHKRTG